jgi:hypothetical protein
MNRLLALGVLAVLLALAIGRPLPITLAQSYALHVGAGAAAVLALRALLSPATALMGALVVAGTISLEAVQGCCLPGRSADPLDAIAGIAGALAALVLLRAAR